MKKINIPIPIDQEIVLDPYKTIMSKTDKKGIIEYANDYFMEISGYKEWELMAQPHNVIRHPDMPKIVFKLLWQRLDKGQNIHAIVKNLAKDGRYYWVVTDFQTGYDHEGNIIKYYSRRKAIPDNVRDYFSELYKKIIEIERVSGMEASGPYLSGLLAENNTSYDKFILDIFNLSEKELDKYMKAQINDADLGIENITPEVLIKKSKKKKLFKFF